MSKNKGYLFTKKLWRHIKDTSINKKCRFVSYKGDIFEVTKENFKNGPFALYSVENINCVVADEIEESEETDE